MKESILLLNMFSGDFAQDHIAHEIVNLFQTDDERYFIYAPHDGKPTENCRKTSKILMLRHLGSGRYEVIGRAFVKRSISLAKKDQREILDSMIYGGRPFESIMETSGREFKETECITFEAISSERPRNAIFLNCCERDSFDLESKGEAHAKFQTHVSDENTKEGIYITTGKRSDGSLNLLVQHQRRFIDSDNELYETLDRLFFEKPERFEWEPFGKVEDFASVPLESAARFLALINKEESELAYSNLLAHYLDENPDIASEFIRFLLKKADVNPHPQDLIPFDILREKHHIDILINTHDKVFILENKVHADLSKHGDAKSEETQLNKYVEKIAEIFPDKERLVYILCPPYHGLRKSQQSNPMMVEGNVVPLISYADLYAFLSKFDSVRGGAQENRYYQDFLAMLQWQMADHQKDLSRKHLDLSMKRFQRAIEIDKALH